MGKETPQLTPSDYVHLHNHSHHSLLDGLTKIPALVSRVKELGMEAVALTDHGTMSGSIELYKGESNLSLVLRRMSQLVLATIVIRKKTGLDTTLSSSQPTKKATTT
jgi:DNA polymerase III alpha subunit